MNYKRLGNYIEPCNEKNDGNKIKLLQGISNKKYFQKAKTNTIGIDLSKYRIVRKGQFAFNRATTRNGEKISIGLQLENDCIVSPSYRIFKSKDDNILNSEYLMMWFRRPEFDRYARFKSHGSAHEFFDYDEMCEVTLPIPSIEQQQQIVDEYNTVTNRIQLNEKINTNLEATAQALYKHWFVDFEFPNADGNPYKSSGGTMVYNEELDKEIPAGWSVDRLENICLILNKKRKPISGIDRENIQGIYPYYGAMGIVDYINDYIFNGTYLLIAEDGVYVTNKNGNPSLQYVWGKFWVNNHAHILQGNNLITNEYLKLALSVINVAHLVTGAAQPKINLKNLSSILITVPKEASLEKFNKKVIPIYAKYKIQIEQNIKLKELQNLLLAKMTQVELKPQAV